MKTKNTPFMVAVALAAMVVPVLSSAQPVEDGSWHLGVGIGLVSQPKYPGSSEIRTGAMPTFSATKGRWQIGSVPGGGIPLGLGYTLLQDGPWRLGVGVGTSLGKPRNANDGSKLSSLGEIRQTVLGSVSGSYTQGNATASASIISDIGGHQQGTRALMDLMFKARPMDRLVLSAGPGITLMNSQYAQTYYGVTSAQSTSSGYPSYKARAGVNALRLGLGADFQLTREWSVSAKLGATRLQGDAANSPTLEKTTQTSYGLFANYRF